MAVCVAYMAIYGPTPGLKGRTFELSNLNRWFLNNFCVSGTSMRGEGGVWRSHSITAKLHTSWADVSLKQKKQPRTEEQKAADRM